MNQLSSSSKIARQNALLRCLYRKLLRECQRIPPKASLTHLDQWINSTQIKDRDTLRSCLRSSFRGISNIHDDEDVSNSRSFNKKFKTMKVDGVQRALEGLNFILSIDWSSSQFNKTEEKGEGTGTEEVSPPQQNEKNSSSNGNGQKQQQEEEEDSSFLQPPLFDSDELLASIEWLPPISEMEDKTTIDEEDDNSSSQFPIFPLSGPLFPDNEGMKLPLLSHFSDATVAGMTIPLKIFEPRYRQMYQDLLNTDNDDTEGGKGRRFIVPFPHPYQSGQFASYGWMYEIVSVQDVADETNGKFQLVCDHLITQPVKLHGILNPTDYKTKSTYLKASRAEIINNIFSDNDEKGGDHSDKNTFRDENQQQEERNSTNLQPQLEELLQMLKKNSQRLSLSSADNINWHQKIDQTLIDRLIMAVSSSINNNNNKIWPIVEVYILILQTEILKLQMIISTRIQAQAKAAAKEDLPKEWQSFVTKDIIELAQYPYKNHLKCMLIEVSTIIPWLLQEESQNTQCHLLCKRIRDRLMPFVDTEQ